VKMNKINRSVVRNKAYSREKAANQERHNERKNEHYGNGDIDLNRSEYNVHFKEYQGGYLQQFDKMTDDGVISTRGLKPTAKIIDELIFDVNSEYFENKGGYDYAKSFFESAYRLAVKEVGGEQFILSAVMHADERNKFLSEKLGRDVYHYHLHVVYVPVVDKEIKWTKRCKNPALVGTTKEIIKQVSNSKKWASQKENGKIIYSYSLLQDRFFEGMRAAGFDGFERGEKGSTAEHLDVIEYKTKKEQERLTALESETKVKKKIVKEFESIDGMAQKGGFLNGGKVTLTTENWERVSELAKEGLKSRGIIKTLKEKIQGLLEKIAGLEKRLADYKGKGISESMEYFKALSRAPRRLKETIADIMRKPPEQTERDFSHSMAKKRTNELE